MTRNRILVLLAASCVLGGACDAHVSVLSDETGDAAAKSDTPSTATEGGAEPESGGAGPLIGEGGAPTEGTGGGLPSCVAACADDPSLGACAFDDIRAMPQGATVVDFDTCAGCGCCLADGSYPETVTVACYQCGVDSALAANGIQTVGAMGTFWVYCITGNAAAPMADAALFMGTPTSPDTYELDLELDHGVAAFGLSAAPSSDDATPLITVEGYAADGTLVGSATYDWADRPGGSCDLVNARARFLGIQSCGVPMTHFVVRAVGPNSVVDTIAFF